MLSKINLLLIELFITLNIFAVLPEVTSKNNDPLYKQLQIDISENKSRIMQNKEILPLQFYKYILEKDDTIFTVSSRFNLTYDTLSSLNNIENQLFFYNLESILIPSCQGLYSKSKLYKDSISINIENESYFFSKGKSFTGKERLNFLITPFKSPLNNMVVTSEFGHRENPFTQISEYHSGLDVKAKVGTKLFSPYKGVINSIGYSGFYGNYLIIEHTNGYSSHYYHLKNIILKEGDPVKKGDLVAYTGNSGKSTGPHLHLEIHLNGVPINPRILLGDV